MLSKIWNNCCQEKWKVMSKLWAKPCCECIHSAHCVAGVQAGLLFACASCTPLLHSPPYASPYFHYFFLSKLCLVWVLACWPCPGLLFYSAPLPPPGSVAWLPGGGSLLTSGAAGMPDGPIHQTCGWGVGVSHTKEVGVYRWLYWDSY